MAVSLSSSLLEHQRGSRRQPALRVTVSSSRAGVPILRWEAVHRDPTSIAPHAAVLTASGALVRVRNNAGALELAREADADAPSATFDAWSGIGTASAGSPVALATHGSEILLLSCSGSGKTIEALVSADDGETWGAASPIASEATAIGSIAVAMTPSGDACVFFVAGTGTNVKRLRRTAGAWDTSGTTWPRSGDWDSVSGIAAAHDGVDFVLAVTGVEAGSLDGAMNALQMGDTGLPPNAWTAMQTVARADAGSSVRFEAPTIAFQAGSYRAMATRRESGNVAAAATVALNTLKLAGPLSNWTEAQPWRDASGGAAALAGFGGAAWVAMPGGVYRASLDAPIETGEHLLEAQWRIAEREAKARFEFSDPARALEKQLIPGDALSVRAGYRSGAAGSAEYGIQLEFSIERVTTCDANGRRTVAVECGGPWEALRRWRSPESWQVGATEYTRDELFSRVAVRAGIPASSMASPAPPDEWMLEGVALALTPGEAAAAALERLLVGMDVIAIPGNGGLRLRGVPEDEGAAWAFGQDGHPITMLRASRIASPVGVRLVAADRYADAFDETSGPLRPLSDPSAATDAAAVAHAASVLRSEYREQVVFELSAPFHAGLEVGDVVTLNDARADASGGRFRVLSAGMRFQRGAGAGRFESVIELGRV